MEFGQDDSPWGTTGRDLPNGASLLSVFEGVQEVQARFKAMPIAMQININFFTQLLRWLLQTALETFTTRAPLPSVPDNTLHYEASLQLIWLNIYCIYSADIPFQRPVVLF